MSEISATVDRESVSKDPSIWSYIISVSVSIVLIIGISQFVFNLVPERSEFVETEKVADETYKKFSQRLEAMSKVSAKEMEATKKDG